MNASQFPEMATRGIAFVGSPAPGNSGPRSCLLHRPSVLNWDSRCECVGKLVPVPSGCCRFGCGSDGSSARRRRVKRGLRWSGEGTTQEDPRRIGIVWNGRAADATAQQERDGEESPAADLRKILASPGAHQGPACFDALSARLVEMAGFSYTFMSGFAVSAVRLGAPDMGLLSYGEVLEQGRLITNSVSIPVIGDGDNGYGNALNVKRTVKGFIKAGFAGILIEDQDSPKACGHFEGKKVVSREEALTRIKAAVDARSESKADIVIIARSDARQAECLEEALWRVEKFVEVGADVIFIDALASKEEMQAFCRVAPGTPKMANMLEGGGRTPILSPLELQELGFKLIAYPLSLVGVSIQAMQDALKALKSGRLPPPGDLPTFEEIKKVVGVDKFFEEEQRYALGQWPQLLDSSLPIDRQQSDESSTEMREDLNAERQGFETGVANGSSEQGKTVEETSVVIPDILPEKEKSSPQSPIGAIWSRFLRVKVTGSTGDVKLDVRIPAGFLDGLSSTIPGVAGMNLRKLLEDAGFSSRGNLESGQQLVDITDRRGERIQVFLE